MGYMLLPKLLFVGVRSVFGVEFVIVKEEVSICEDNPVSFGVQQNVSYEGGDVQMDSSKLSIARFAVFVCGRRCLLTANADVGESVPMPMPMRRSRCRGSDCRIDCRRW
jgi:hypothetical protein